MTAPVLGIGSRVWLLGGGRSGEAWNESTITGETRISWLVGQRQEVKLAKRDPYKLTLFDFGPTRVAFSEAEVREIQWCDRNAWAVADAIRCCRKPEVVREIARLVGYQERK